MDYGLSSKLRPDDTRQDEFRKQREERGFDDTETWNLDCTFALFMLPRLKRFREIEFCCPADTTKSKWNKTLDQMIEGFECYQKGILVDDNKVNKAWKLLAKHYANMWW